MSAVLELPLSARAALVAISAMDRPCDAVAIDATLAGFGFRRATVRRWWSGPSEWFDGASPAAMLNRGEGRTVLLGVATALIESVQLLADAGHFVGVRIVAERLRDARAPSPLIDAVAAITARGNPAEAAK